MIEVAADLARRGGELGALQILAAALKASPRHPQGHTLRLELLRRIGPEKDLNAWISSLRTLYERAEATPPMVLELAFAEERLGDPDAALDHYQELVALAAVRAAPPELLEHVHAGIARCEAALQAAREQERGEDDEDGRERGSGKGKKGAGRSAPAQPPRQAAPPSEREAQVLAGRASMQLPREEAPVPVELPVELELVPGGPLLERLARNELDPLRSYRLAEETWRWGWGLDSIAALQDSASAAEAGSAQAPAGSGPAPPAELAVPPGLEPEVAVVLERMGCRALVCSPSDDRAAELALAVIARLQRERRLGRTLILAPQPLLPLWERDLRPLAATTVGEALRLADSAGSEAGAAELVRFAPDLVVVDQAQQASSPDSRLSRLVQQLAAPGLLLLTSMPVLSDLLSLHGLVSLVRPGLLGTASAFRRNHVSKSEAWQAQNPQALRQAIAPCVVYLAAMVDRDLERGSTAASSCEPALELRRPVATQDARSAAELLELVRWEPAPGVVLCRSAELARPLRELLAQEQVTGWQVLGDDEPLPMAPHAAKVAVHLDLPLHPALGALRGKRFARSARQIGLLAAGSTEALLAGLGREASGLPASGEARPLMRLLLRARDPRPPLELVLAGKGEAGEEGARRALGELEQELGRVRELVQRSSERSLALFVQDGEA